MYISTSMFFQSRVIGPDSLFCSIEKILKAYSELDLDRYTQACTQAHTHTQKQCRPPPAITEEGE